MFAVGDYVVKANSGVCRIEDITSLNISDAKEGKLYYLLVPQDDKGAKVYVPVDTGSASLREVLSEQSAWDIIEKIPDIDETSIPDEKMREQEYRDAIKSTDPELLVGVIKNIYIRCRERYKQGKKSTSVDERYFRMAEQALYSELAFAIGRQPEEMDDIIMEKLGRQEEK